MMAYLLSAGRFAVVLPRQVKAAGDKAQRRPNISVYASSVIRTGRNGRPDLAQTVAAMEEKRTPGRIRTMERWRSSSYK